MKRERFPPRTASCALETAKVAGEAHGGGAGSMEKGCARTHTHTHEASPAQAPGSGQHRPNARLCQTRLAQPSCPVSSLARASPQLPKCVPEPRSGITIRQHSAFCNLMLLCPNLLSWKKTKACRFYDVNSEILGV